MSDLKPTSFENFPTEHSPKHLVTPFSEENRPVAHAEQSFLDIDCSTVEKKPAAHLVHLYNKNKTKKK